ncbi:glyoxalase superfamily protein [Hymenobacter artigasi]|uniref:Glyoxalase superfamily protein PhnB n=1 Tax=Hymenobacter artigasi TaxID=2719616 RepID=A0ABX1HEE2_9BACT|nr:glyoxalase superfamily protein [Hymenobacter artigasi]NKI88609.1 putative glyoxalase superfamily protein PhnB [Hymenobacter artigasi]
MVTPIFQILDYQQALDFYIDWLGFRIDWQDQSVRGPLYMQVSRGGIVLHLSSHPEESCAGAKAMAEINGLIAFHHMLTQKASAYPSPVLQKTCWSDKVMQVEVTDPFGNILVFAELCA